MQTFQTCQDAMGRATDILFPSTHRCVVILAGGAAKSVPVPPSASTVLFNATAPFWVQYGGAASLPAADCLDGTAPELSPAGRQVKGIASLGLVAPDACTVSLTFFG